MHNDERRLSIKIVQVTGSPWGRPREDEGRVGAVLAADQLQLASDAVAAASPNARRTGARRVMRNWELADQSLSVGSRAGRRRRSRLRLPLGPEPLPIPHAEVYGPTCAEGVASGPSGGLTLREGRLCCLAAYFSRSHRNRTHCGHVFRPPSAGAKSRRNPTCCRSLNDAREVNRVGTAG